MVEPNPQRARRIVLIAASGAIPLIVLVPAAAGLAVDFGSFAPLLLAFALVGAFWPYTVWRRMQRLQAAIETFLLSFVVAILTLVCSYSAMRMNRPLQDGFLASIDSAIGFNSQNVVHWVDQFPMLCALLGLAYVSIMPQIVWLPVLLCLLGRPERGYALSFALLVLCCVCSIVASYFPANAAYVHYGIGPGDLKNIDATLGSHFLESFNAVRNQADFVLSASNGSGIVTYPSGHAGAALLCGWAAWGSKWLRWPLLALNAVMFASAITHGAHYLIDLLAGGVVAAAIAAVTARLFWGAPLGSPGFSRRAAPAALA